MDRVAEILPRGAGEVEIHYTGLSYVAPEKVRFKYRLEGIDATGWTPARDGSPTTPACRRVITGSMSSPATTTACGTKPAHCAFRLIPHFYQTRWFLPLVFLLVAGLAAAAYGFRIRQLRANERKLQRRVDEAVAQVKV